MEMLIVAFIVLAVGSIVLSRIVAGVVEHRKVMAAKKVILAAIAKQTTVSVSMPCKVAMKALSGIATQDKKLTVRVSFLASQPILVTDFAGARVAVWTH